MGELKSNGRPAHTWHACSSILSNSPDKLLIGVLYFVSLFKEARYISRLTERSELG